MMFERSILEMYAFFVIVHSIEVKSLKSGKEKTHMIY